MFYQRIKYFIKTADTGSFSKAAAELFVSPQALTKQMSLFEEEMGGKLFERNARGVVLTSLGEYAYSRFVKVDNELEEALRAVKERAANNVERINVGVFASLPQDTLVSPIVTYILGTCTRYRIGLELIDLDMGKRMLHDGRLDILLTNTHEEDDWGDARILSFGSMDAKVFVSKLHPWVVKKKITVDDMKSMPFLKMDAGNEHYKVPEKDSFYNNIPCREIVRITNFETMYALLLQGNAFAIFPEAYEHSRDSKLISFDYPGKAVKFHTALICKSDNKKGFGDIIDDLKEEFDLEEIIQK